MLAAHKIDAMASPLQYIRCRTCGSYLPQHTAMAERYCSTECTDTYSACMNCGRYYRNEDGYNQGICSRECAVTYKLNRVFGPESVRVMAEELQ
jgi:hypothetical protein